MNPPEPLDATLTPPTSGPFATLAIFSLIGPLLGALPLALIIAVASALSAGGFGMVWVILLFAYPFGLVPAMLAGLYYLALRHFAHQPNTQATLRTNAMQGMLAGAAGTLSFVTLLYPGSLDNDNFGEHILGTSGIVVFPGLIAGSLCGVLTRAGMRQRLRRWF